MAGDPLTVTPVPTNYPIVITVCLSLFGTTVLTWCLGLFLEIIIVLRIFSGEDKIHRLMACVVLYSLA